MNEKKIQLEKLTKMLVQLNTKDLVLLDNSAQVLLARLRLENEETESKMITMLKEEAIKE